MIQTNPSTFEEGYSEKYNCANMFETKREIQDFII